MARLTALLRTLNTEAQVQLPHSSEALIIEGVLMVQPRVIAMQSQGVRVLLSGNRVLAVGS